MNKITRRYFEKPGDTLSDVPESWSDDGYIMSRYDPGDRCILHFDG